VNIEELIRQYGYWMVAGGTLVEGDATLLAAAFLAHRGYLSLAWVCTLAGLTTVVQNHVMYELARRQGASLIEGTGKTSLRIQRVLGWVRARGALIVLASRFLLGVRSTAALACGIAQMPRRIFFWSNLVGAAVWTVAFAFAGYSGGHLFTLLVADVKRHEFTVAAGLAVVVTIGVLWKTHASDVVDQTIAAGMIEEWAKS
jgi:membrane protein DedA with SNARE-associated domain